MENDANNTSPLHGGSIGKEIFVAFVSIVFSLLFPFVFSTATIQETLFLSTYVVVALISVLVYYVRDKSLKEEDPYEVLLQLALVAGFSILLNFLMTHLSPSFVFNPENSFSYFLYLLKIVLIALISSETFLSIKNTILRDNIHLKNLSGSREGIVFYLVLLTVEALAVIVFTTPAVAILGFALCVIFFRHYVFSKEKRGVKIRDVHRGIKERFSNELAASIITSSLAIFFSACLITFISILFIVVSHFFPHFSICGNVLLYIKETFRTLNDPEGIPYNLSYELIVLFEDNTVKYYKPWSGEYFPNKKIKSFLVLTEAGWIKCNVD